MKLTMHFVNSLPGMPFGAFKIGASLTMDTTEETDQAELLALAPFYGRRPEELTSNGVTNPFIVAELMQRHLQYIHEYQYNMAANMPAYMLQLPQIPPRQQGIQFPSQT